LIWDIVINFLYICLLLLLSKKSTYRK